jgi:hypothetical protein
MSIKWKLQNEFTMLAWAMVYFVIWLGALALVKALILREYQIEYSDFSVAMIGALILAKVVVVLEHVPMGTWIAARLAWVDVVVRTALYSVGVFIAIVLEKGFEGRAKNGGFVPAVKAGLGEMNFYRTLANTICLSGALLLYNVFSVFRRHLGGGSLFRLFLKPLPPETASLER